MMEMLLTLREKKVKIEDKIFTIKEMTLAKSMEFNKAFNEYSDSGLETLDPDIMLKIVNMILNPKIDINFILNNITIRFFTELFNLQFRLNSPLNEKETEEILKKSQEKNQEKKS